MIRNRRLHQSAPATVRQQPSPLQAQQFLSYTAANDIQFVAMEPPANSAKAQPSGPPPLSYSGILSEPVYEGPFQVIEPGSELYLQIDSSFCFDSFDSLETGPALNQQEAVSCSENGIPQQVLDDVFRVEDEMQANGDMIPRQYPVADHLSMADYEVQLVAEMEKLFPQAPQPVAPPGSRLMEELTKIGSSDNPCYMSVHFKSDGTRNGRNVPKKFQLDLLKRDKERGFRCVDMVDGNGKIFKAKYYEHITIQKQPKTFASVPISKEVRQPVPYRRITELLQSTQLANVSPSVVNKIERLANNNRNVTLTPIRGSVSASRVNLSGPATTSTTTIVIKAPKRTIASSTDTESLPPTEHFPMPIIKQEPLDEPPAEAELQQQLSVIDSTRIEVPIITPTVANTVVSKQPRKQKLQSLSQCDMVFNESAGMKTVPPAPVCGGRAGDACAKNTIPPPRARMPNDYVTVTIKDANGNVKKQPQQLRPTRQIVKSHVPVSSTSVSFNKRITHYRVETIPKEKRVFGQPVESIEILDSSDEEVPVMIPVPVEAEFEEVPKPKLPGNTESIQCPFCCKIFMSPHSLLLHRQTCADAVMFRTTNRNKPPNKQIGKEKISLLKRSFNPLVTANQKSSKNPEQQPDTSDVALSKKNDSSNESTKDRQSDTKKKRASVGHKRSEQLSIEILHSAFNIDNLLVCDVCKKTFRTQDHLEVHRKIHEAPFVCEYCKKKFLEVPVKHVCQEMKRSVKHKRKSCNV
ncbi:uncharacterized protein LOC131685475 isoform X2 [Topomyia yanbarensis]|uniref:uncharacterized protein LOC131685475 isoform X2 n=1 Tax=Topomyia yanbarensis TaxID=2498891 RepID=UPI00273B186D|nr:uncharacterized protein LOC131685475 isoform X2 [Topomyia yanbarensis]